MSLTNDGVVHSVLTTPVLSELWPDQEEIIGAQFTARDLTLCDLLKTGTVFRRRSAALVSLSPLTDLGVTFDVITQRNQRLP
jgi:hypothetical protein|eukprot:gene3958-4006_t